MKKIQDYEKKAKDILNKRYGIDPNYQSRPGFLEIMPSYLTSEITETITQLVLLDLISILEKES